jgi:hypothetical protein
VEIRRGGLVAGGTRLDHGEADFPLPAGKYLVTGDRDVTTVLTIQPKDKNGNQRWALADGATLYESPTSDAAPHVTRRRRLTIVLARQRAHARVIRFFQGHDAGREGLPQAGLRGSHRRWAAHHTLRTLLR